MPVGKPGGKTNILKINGDKYFTRRTAIATPINKRGDPGKLKYLWKT
jgi:hypothetical protein